MLDAREFQRRPVQIERFAAAGEQIQQGLHGRLK